MNSFQRAVLASVLGLGVVAGLVRAQTPVVPTAPAPVIIYQAPPGNDPVLAPEGANNQSGRRPLRDCLQKHGLACWSHHNSPGCGSLKAECKFIFGSCRDFFGEPCIQNPPSIVPPPGRMMPGGPAPASCNCR
jgi:hypothetical protein